MTEARSPQKALAHIVATLSSLGREFALVGGLGVSVRAEIRFTRDVDLAVVVQDDEDAEQLIFQLGSHGYSPVAAVEHQARSRLATARLMGPVGVVVDLLLASSGIELETTARATEVSIDGVGRVPVARAEELLAMKVPSMNEHRLQDRIDANKLLAFNRDMDLDVVRKLLSAMSMRGYDRGQDLHEKLERLLHDAGNE
jgi:hypothetical protein